MSLAQYAVQTAPPLIRRCAKNRSKILLNKIQKFSHWRKAIYNDIALILFERNITII